MQAQAIYLAFVLGRLHVKKGLALADFRRCNTTPRRKSQKLSGRRYALR